jgi:hypothetical protein
MDSTIRDFPESRPVSGWPSALVGPCFLFLAVWFLYGPETVRAPADEPPAVAPGLLSTAPRRETLGDPPSIEVDGVRRTCVECHQLFEPSVETPQELVIHAHVRLDHGINDRCRNCHHLQDRDRLVLHDGRVIPFSDSQLLCAKCHGPTFRDWERGAHGRSDGYWDRSRGELVRLKCYQCHDPHNPRIPAMDPLVPLPGPRAPQLAGSRAAVIHGGEPGRGPDPGRRAK